MKKTDLPEKQFSVIKWLVENGGGSEYDIGKNVNVSSFVAHQAPKALLTKGLLRFEPRGKARTGRIIRVYYPTFKGFLVYFSLHLPSSPDLQSIQKYYEENRENLRRAISNAQKFYPGEPIFTEWNTIEEWLGETLSYYHLCFAAKYALEHPPATIENYEKVHTILAHIKDDELENLDAYNNALEEENTLWKLAFEEAFALHYSELILSNKVLSDYMKGEISPTPNKKLYRLFQEIIDVKIKEAEERIQRLKLMKKAFKAKFKG